MDRHLENVALAKQYLKALESGPIGDELAKLFAPEVVLEIFSSKFFPNGSRDDLAGDFCRGRARPKSDDEPEVGNQKRGGQRR